MFFIISFVIVTFGQPAWFPFLGILASLFGYALFWRSMLSMPHKKQRFWLAAIWFSAVQLIQLSWFVSHPYYYIYGVWIFFSVAVGLQFGLISLLLNPQKLLLLSRIFLISASWTIMEWSRLFFLSGYSWNPVGLALSGSVYTLQVASIFGVYGMSFLVIFTNLLALRAWRNRYSLNSIALFVAAVFFPLFFGVSHYKYHDTKMSALQEMPSSYFSTILVQTSFPVEESMHFEDTQHLVEFVKEEWKQILKISRKQYGQKVDLLALPELVVPLGTYSFLYKLEDVENTFTEIFGTDIAEKLPNLELPVAYQVNTENGREWMVNNAYWVQSIANIFDANVVIGLEDAEDLNGKREYYSSAIHIVPESKRKNGFYEAQRYAKRILVPMGEYIPFSFCRELAAKYGVYGSFTAGREPEVWECNKGAFGLSICYEEMFGNMMRENRQKGANFLLNITSDAWFPHSKLVKQHLEHSRLRTVENGFPLVRACNTGISCAVDSLGRDIAVLGDSDSVSEDLSDSLHVSFPIYNYQTLYTRFGDGLIIGISFLLILLFFRYR